MQTNEENEVDNAIEIVCCGYRFIQSPKTQLTFPAWLIGFRDPQSSESVYWWRSKRDFLLLGRAAIRYSSIQPPKASLHKLSDRAPWQQPNHDFHGLEQVCTVNNYNVGMKKSVWQVEDYLNAIAVRVSMEDETEMSPLGRAWRDFCRPGHAQGLVEEQPENAQAQEERPAPTTLQSSCLKSSKLGQYFCVRENAQMIVNFAMDWLEKQHDSDKRQHVTFLEPSCGDGQVVSMLLGALASHPAIASFSIIACDIDSNAIAYCKSQITAREVEWINHDFLFTEGRQNRSCQDSLVVALGGPPYTSGAGTGKEMQRDLPERFVSHCFEEWNASFVAFLLPDRYERHAWTLSCETHHLPSSTFYFHGNPITQPSILQCLTRE